MLSRIPKTIVRSTVLRASTSRMAYSTEQEQRVNPLAGIAVPPTETHPRPIPAPERALNPPAQSTLQVPSAEDPALFFFTSMIMSDGKRARARNMTSKMLLWIHGLTRAEPLPIFHAALRSATPLVRSMRWKRGAKMINIPVALNEKQGVRQAIVNILEASEKRAGQTLSERVARECIAVLEGESEALKKKEDAHKQATVSRTNIVGLRR